ncbi:uncharacterized protein LOC111406834 [Olea europaea var. sylvestris]|uniref:uncharacterized protein LOC111406834 n=1 Tax=Olea europaea var. sylvestris TaxID=158386 RepID=UPI000C1D670D|nr:uncharacterized protein LOC111406834 [Olea europaea var. sylvestris]
MKLDVDEAYDLYEKIDKNKSMCPTDRKAPRKTAGIHNVDAMTAMALQMEVFTMKIDNLSQSINMKHRSPPVCEGCGVDHITTRYTLASTHVNQPEEVSYTQNFQRQQNNPYSNTCNPRWRNSPNFSWSNNQNQQASIKNLEQHMGQMVAALSSRAQEMLSSVAEINPKEQLKAITIYIGIQLREIGVKQPTSVIEKEARFGKAKLTTISLQLADGSIRHLQGKALIDIDIIKEIVLETFILDHPEDPLEVCSIHSQDLLSERRKQKNVPPLFKQPHLELDEGPTTTLLSIQIKRDQLSMVLQEHKTAIKWTILDIKGISPSLCMQKILMEDDYKASVEYQLIPTRTVTGWRVCINYHKLNNDTRKDHFLLPFIDQRLARNTYYYFLDAYSSHLLELYDVIFSNMVGNIIEVFIDDFLVFGRSFKECLKHLGKLLQRREDINLISNWEKCHFIVQEEIVLRHLISVRGIEVNKAKIQVIEKLPPSTIMKGVGSFLGHTGFHRRFIKDYSKLSKPLCNLLEKSALFHFVEECLTAFNTLKEKLVSVPVLASPNWDYPFELMYDSSDHVVGTVLGQRKEKISYVIHYASKTLDEAQMNYATIEKKLLAVVFVVHKFKSYLQLTNCEAEKYSMDTPITRIITTPWYANYVNYFYLFYHPTELLESSDEEVL